MRNKFFKILLLFAAVLIEAHHARHIKATVALHRCQLLHKCAVRSVAATHDLGCLVCTMECFSLPWRRRLRTRQNGFGFVSVDPKVPGGRERQLRRATCTVCTTPTPRTLTARSEYYCHKPMLSRSNCGKGIFLLAWTQKLLLLIFRRIFFAGNSRLSPLKRIDNGAVHSNWLIFCRCTQSSRH